MRSIWITLLAPLLFWGMLAGLSACTTDANVTRAAPGSDQPATIALPALPTATGGPTAPQRNTSAAVRQAHFGNDCYDYADDAVLDETSGTAMLAASDGAACWGMYQFTDYTTGDHPIILDVALAAPLPSSLYLGISDYTHLRWQWTKLDAPAAQFNLTLPATFDCMDGSGFVYITLLAYDNNSATVRKIALTPRCVLPTPEFGCEADGHAAVLAGQQVAWGDLHSHTSYSADAVNYNACTATPGEACAWARDTALLDFVAITDHAEDGPPGEYTQEKWDNMLDQESSLDTLYPSEKSIIVFPGFEYTKCSFGALPEGNGHRNIICKDFSTVPGRGWGFDTYTLPTDLWAYLNSSPAAGNYICIPHHPAKGSDKEDPIISMKTDWSTSYVDAQLQPLVEIYSKHGSSDSQNADEERVNDFDVTCSVEAALGRWLSGHNAGYKLGIVASTDTHDGNPGGVEEIPANVDDRLGALTGGLAAVWTPALDRDGIWSGLTGKRCYGTSGARIALEFTAALGNQVVPMGGTLSHVEDLSDAAGAQVNLHIRAASAAGEQITRIEVTRNGQIILDLMNPEWTDTAHLDYTDMLNVDFAYYRIKVWQAKASNPLPDNVAFERAWSSPVWIELE